jgi:acetoacetate decarboxylase
MVRPSCPLISVSYSKVETHWIGTIMFYPAAPWQLYGTALQSLHAIDLATARQFVPVDFEIVPVLPGKTVGSLYLSVYEPSSTLEYHELIVAPALVRYRGKIGAWISHIYVDNPVSVAGGRNIWGLPKELADFTWHDRDLTVSQGNTLLCRVDRSAMKLPLSFWGKLKIGGDVFGSLDRDILSFRGDVETGLKWTPFQLSIPTESPFFAVNLGNPWLTVQLDNLHLTANAASSVGRSMPPAFAIHRET